MIRSTFLAVCIVFSIFIASLYAQQEPAPAAATAPPGISRSELAGITVEDWTTLSLTGSDLKPETPLLAETAQFPQFSRQLVQLKWRAGDPIELYVIKPKAVEKPPAVLYLYSYPSETDRFLDDGFCQRVTRDGVAAIGFVSALTGHRYHMRPMKEWFVSELQESLASSVHDVQLILDYLASRGDLDLERIGMFGAGSGGAIAILSASTDPRIKAIDLLDPWGDWPDWMATSSMVPEAERPNYLKPEFQKKIAGFDPVQWLPRLTYTKVRLQQVADDQVTPPAARERIAAALPASAEFAQFKDTAALFHTTSGGHLFDWIKGQLKPSTSRLASEVTAESSNPTAARPR